MNQRKGSREALLALASVVLIAGASLSTPAAAADAGAVIKACDNTPGCSYTQNKKNGDISGCSSQTCFYCPADGKHSCFQVRKHGKSGPRGTIIGGIKLSPAPKNYRRHQVKAGALKTKTTYRHRSTGPTNPNGPDTGPIGPGGTGPYAPPEHRRTSGGQRH